MELLTIQEQQVQAQHGLQLSPEEYKRQCDAIDMLDMYSNLGFSQEDLNQFEE
jgi:hypothetical protein